MGSGRGVDIMLSAFSSPRLSLFHVAFVGYGELSSRIAKFCGEFPNIHFLDAVPSADVVSSIADADIGIIFIQDFFLNNRFCLPNKLFEYYLAAIPAVVSDFPEMSNFIRSFNCGWVVNPDLDSFLDFAISFSKHAAVKKKIEMSVKPNAIGWHLEEQIMIDVYRRILAEARH